MEKNSNASINSGEPPVESSPINFPTHSGLSEKEQKKMNAMLGGHKDNVVKSIANEKDQPLRKLTDHASNASLYFKNCQNSEYSIDELCTKVFIEGCSNCKFTLNGKIVTSTVDTWKCDDLELNINTPVGTLQVDVCKKLNVTYDKKEYLQTLVWAQAFDLSIDFKDGPQHKMVTGFEQEKANHPNLALDVDQFIVRFVKEKLLSEQIVRLHNGYPTTEREAIEFERRQEENLKKMAKEMGISIGKKKPTGPKVKPNEPCTCGSGKKFKKCHGKNDL